MTKREFLSSLRAYLAGLPTAEADERIRFYREMIDDRMEDGLSEEEAVAAVGSAEEIAVQITAEIPLTKIAKERIKPKRRLAAWEIVLLAIGSPIWLSLLIAVVSVVLSLYLTLWAVVASLWAVFASFVACGVCCVAVGVATLVRGDVLAGGALLGAGFVLAGLSIFVFFGCRAATKGTVWLLTATAAGIKRRLMRKEAV